MSNGAPLKDHAVQGLAAGALFGGLDAGIAHYHAPGVHPPGWLLLACVAFGLLGALAGTALGGALRLAAARRPRWRPAALGARLTLFGLVLLVVNLHILRVMPGELFSLVVLGVNAGLLVALGIAVRTATARGETGESRLAGKRFRRGVVSAWLVALAAFAAFLHLDARGLAARSEETGGRNVLWIVMDTTRADSVLVPGATPALERLAAGGARFENAYSAASWTLPSHASMFTGTYPSRHGLTGLSASFVGGRPGQDRGRHLVQRKLRETTVASVFGAAGYATTGFSENPWVSRGTGLAIGFEEFYDTWDYPGRNASVFERAWKRARISGLVPGTHTRRTVAALERWLRERDASRPFLAFVNFLEPHAPYAPPAAYAPPIAPPAPSSALGKAAHDPLSYVAGQADLDAEGLAALRALYDAEVTSLDAEIGTLIEFLEDSELLADTIVVVTSDHGENFGWQGLASHAFAVNEALIRVPLVVHAPGIVPSGRSIDLPVSLIDLFPTLTALCDLPFDHAERLQGRSLLPLLESDADPGPELAGRSIFAEDAENRALLDVAMKDYPEHDWSPYERSLQSILREGVKYVRGSDGEQALYDLAEDPDEQSDLLWERAALASELAEKLEHQVRLNVIDAKTGDDEVEALDPEVLERLRSLGYVD
jgi:arylsulfatase A-like enzyme